MHVTWRIHLCDATHSHVLLPLAWWFAVLSRANERQKNTISNEQSPIFSQKRPMFPEKSLICSHKSPHILSKEPLYMLLLPQAWWISRATQLYMLSLPQLRGRTYSKSCVARLIHVWKLYDSFAQEPYKRDYIMQKRPIIWRSLQVVATPYVTHLNKFMPRSPFSVARLIQMCDIWGGYDL